jgi:hypothetical protein
VRCTDVEITPPSPRPPPARVRRSLPFTTILLPELQHNFLSLPDFAFLLFSFLYFTELLCFTEMLFAFKMGVKKFWTSTDVREASTILSFKFATIV